MQARPASSGSLVTVLIDTPVMRLARALPYDFQYEFTCSTPGCKGHKLGCTDWEMGESYRKWKRAYGVGWEEKFRDKYERDLVERADLHFFVGTLHQHPNAWMIVGLFYPPKPKAPSPVIADLFS